MTLLKKYFNEDNSETKERNEEIIHALSGYIINFLSFRREMTKFMKFIYNDLFFDIDYVFRVAIKIGI